MRHTNTHILLCTRENNTFTNRRVCGFLFNFFCVTMLLRLCLECGRSELKLRFGIAVAFLSTHSGLTRWKDIRDNTNDDSDPGYGKHIRFEASVHCNCVNAFAMPTDTISASTTNIRWTRSGTSGRSNSILSSRKASCSRCHSMWATAPKRWSLPVMPSSIPTTRSPHRWRWSAISSSTPRSSFYSRTSPAM